MVSKIVDHLINLVILNAYILNRHYGLQKMSQDEYRDYLVKYLVCEGLKCYKIPLPPVLSKKIGRNHTSEHDMKRLDERHFITNIPVGEGRKRKRPTRACFVCSKVQGLNLNFKQKRTSFWCEDCEKALCISPCFNIYHTEIDYKLHALTFSEQGLETLVIQANDGNENE